VILVFRILRKLRIGKAGRITDWDFKRSLQEYGAYNTRHGSTAVRGWNTAVFTDRLSSYLSISSDHVVYMAPVMATRWP
jgi:hypothetical protein